MVKALNGSKYIVLDQLKVHPAGHGISIWADSQQSTARKYADSIQYFGCLVYVAPGMVWLGSIIKVHNSLPRRQYCMSEANKRGVLVEVPILMLIGWISER